ncbi:hypothetical protein CFP65_3426 [Kitasatospora sp. MMS16-BH015]|uniref:DUF3592 domain-containing protein n=1 Tax=Kitasatospora sp. MMS16-BH015 TaxID=2018025 RepID=UPI000CA0A1AB|nr:DUF3592 domain-containing protein [Kitasatospora sp. MMS16-BH015]AUG78222.1 hypothetical protein CFP65_3426 [Kitasatospora sp. MMS16-BH015]
METPTAMSAGVVLTFFGGALLLWCAFELRLRHHLRRHGVSVSARVVADGDPYGEPYGDPYGELDSAPLLSYSTLPSVGLAGAATGEATRSESVLARPRGITSLRRPVTLAPGAIVQVSYDARRPSRVVLATGEAISALPSDIFWALLGTSTLAGGLSLLSSFLAK